MKRHITTIQKGFTLIELLIVITIIVALAVTVFVALNPVQRLKDARDARRTADVETILTAIHEAIVDNKGTLPSNMGGAGAEIQIGNGSSGCAIATGGCSVVATVCADIMTGSTNVAKYLKSQPTDPTGGVTYTASKSGYSVAVDVNGLITVKACGTEGSTNISQSR
ncbi:MAG TPA: type II secretion system protein [Methylomirabilota bacterium]|nr:type II secretion system protein [Methylomirabilota bacterium]